MANPEPTTNGDDSKRRSGRARKPIDRLGVGDPRLGSPPPPKKRRASPPPRRRRASPPRKRRATPPSVADPPAASNAKSAKQTKADADAVALRDALTELDSDEAEEFEGWVEFVSEAGKFNKIIEQLGVSDFHCCDVLDVSRLDLLRRPLYGFILLFGAGNIPDPVVAPQSAPEGMWFARQTTPNSCASVALHNILMNANGTGTLGDEMQELKDKTADMTDANRGVALAQNVFARKAHNYFARRLELLEADLLIKREYDARPKGAAAKKPKAKPKAKPKPKTLKRKRDAFNANSCNHYVAYIEHGNKVWELDGLEDGVICVADSFEGDWADAARGPMQEKMIQAGGVAGLFAICDPPRPWRVPGLRQRLVVNVASIIALQSDVNKHPEWTVQWTRGAAWREGEASPDYADGLQEMGLTADEVANALLAISRVGTEAQPQDGGKGKQVDAGDGAAATAQDQNVATNGEGGAANGEEAAADDNEAPANGDGGAANTEDKAANGEKRAYRGCTTEEEAQAEAKRLCEENEGVDAMYQSERRGLIDMEADAGPRLPDFTSLVHGWVEALCEADALKEVADAAER